MMGGTGTFGLVLLELSFEVGAIGEDPATLDEGAVEPLSHELHASLSEGVCATSFLFAVFPPASVRVFVDVGENAFTVSFAIFPVTVILSFLFIDHLPDAVLLVRFEVPFILVPRQVGVLPSALADLPFSSQSHPFFEVAFVDLHVAVHRRRPAREVPR